MNYHIGTMLIDENFDERCECPICRIKATVDERLTEQYLGEGVMEDNTRTEVNKLGFCEHHYASLFASRSKLGLALQVSTRLNTINKEVFEPKNVKQAKKQAESLLKLNQTCVVCKYLEQHMIRYYKTVAEVYSNVASFKNRDTARDPFLSLSSRGLLPLRSTRLLLFWRLPPPPRFIALGALRCARTSIPIGFLA